MCINAASFDEWLAVGAIVVFLAYMLVLALEAIK